MRIFLTGGTGFIGGEVARLLRERGDDVRALVRNPAKASSLEALGCELFVGDLSDEEALVRACADCDAVVHGAALYEVGVPESRRPEMVDANVGGTERVLGAALSAGVRKAVYISTVAVFGDTRGEVADEQWQRPDPPSYTSVYEETKVLAHRRAGELAARGLPLVIVQPGVVYGAGDASTFGQLLDQFLDGKLPALPFPDLGVTPVHRDDVAAGVLLALDEGVPGQSYVLAGDPVRVRDLVRRLGEAAGRRPPRVELPTLLIRLAAPFGRFVGPALGFPPNLREVLTSSDGVTFWATGKKAESELGWRSRPLVDGLRQLVEARA
ncbi:MAG: NAD-dependent epimerase/dehydratase family protein [Actinobacteria bacterium]|nr:NAD-dependent epimerase/dehydratase family protein [Actinomycetota bacterium]MCA1722044.1 NAD-dependent epimerase/dehydratase family protein [Actinomycetota bacterium]